MKGKMTFICLLLTLTGFGGCDVFDSNKTHQRLYDITTQTQIMSERLDRYQAVVNEVVKELKNDKIVGHETASRIEKASQEIDRIQDNILTVAKAVQEADYKADSSDLENLLIAAKKGTEASAPFNPYAPIMLAVLGLAETITLAILRKKSIRLARTNEGVQKFEGMSDPETASRLHDMIKAKIANT